MARIWLIGNGPSLRPSDLTTLHNHQQICFGVNRIHLMYDKTLWRPNYWCLSDRSRQQYVGIDIDFHLKQGYPCYVRADVVKGAEAILWDRLYKERFIPWIQCEHLDCDHNPATSWHADGSLCKYGGSLATAAQIAVMLLGFDEIYFIGCNGNYRPNDVNNFSREYVNPDSLVVPNDILLNKSLAHAHGIMGSEFRKRGVMGYDATRNGKLGSWTRVDFDSLWR